MEEYLCMTREALNELDEYTKVHVVIGNEACDLDSTISAIVYAYYLYTIDEDDSTLFLPLMQIPRGKFRLRLEAVHFLEKIGIEQDVLTFYEEISLLELHSKDKLLVTLVDHHVLNSNLIDLESDVVTVLDHRPVDKVWPDSCTTIIHPVGSCCTLIAEVILANPEFPFDGVVNVLLYGTILVDTINMSPEAGKTTDKDRIMLQTLEDSLGEMGVDRDTLYEDLQSAKFDLSGLTTSEILEKDVKLIHSNNLVVVMSSITMDIKELYSREDVESELRKFTEINEAQVVVLMTLSTNNGSPSRQLALYSDNRIYRQQIIDVLLATHNPSLQLELMESPVENLKSYHQGNVKASRKAVLPIIKGFLNGEPSPDEAINHLQSTLSPGDHGSLSSVIGAMADSGKGESDHEQHFLSNETVSPENIDIFDPFSPQSNTTDSAEKNITESELFQEFNNQASSNTLLNNAPHVLDNDKTEISHPNTGSIMDINISGNDVSNMETAVNNSFLTSNQLDDEYNIDRANTALQTDQVENINFELTEADMFGFGEELSGISSPHNTVSGQNSGQGSKVSSYPVTPPNSYFETDFMNKQHTLPSFNNSEMVQIIKAKQASLRKSDSDNNSEENDTEPFTPANSYITDNFNQFAKETNLPSFQNADLVKKIQEKRASLDASSGIDSLEVNPFPFTPHNSYVDRSLDQFAQAGLVSSELSKRLSEEQLNLATEADQFLESDLLGFDNNPNPTSPLEMDFGSSAANLPVSSLPHNLDLMSQPVAQADLLSMGYSKSGSSDTESFGDMESPSSQNQVMDTQLQNSNNNYPTQIEPLENKNSPQDNALAESDHQQSSNQSPDNLLIPEDLLKNLEKDTSSNIVALELARQMSAEQQVDDLFKTILCEAKSDASDNVMVAQLADKMSLQDQNDAGDIFDNLLDNSTDHFKNVQASQLAHQMSSDLTNSKSEQASTDIPEYSTADQQQPDILFNNLLNDSKEFDNVVASKLAEDMISVDLLSGMMNEPDSSANVRAVEIADDLNNDNPKESGNVSNNLMKDSETDHVSSVDLLSGMMSEPDSSANVRAVEIADGLNNDNSKDANVSNNLLKDSEIDHVSSVDLLSGMMSDSNSSANVRAVEVADDLNKDNPNASVNVSNNSAIDNVLSSDKQMVDLMDDLLQSTPADNVVSSQLNQQMSLDEQKDNTFDTKTTSTPPISGQSSIDILDELMGMSSNENVIVDEIATSMSTATSDLALNENASNKASFNKSPADFFDPFSSVTGDELDKTMTPFDPFSSVKSEESLTSPKDTNPFTLTSPTEVSSPNPFLNEPINSFNPFLNTAEENMSSQQEKTFDPFSTISADGEHMVSGFDDNFQTGGSSLFSEQPEADQSNMVDVSSTLPNQDSIILNNVTIQEPKMTSPTEDSDSGGLQSSAISDQSLSFETGILEESVSSLDFQKQLASPLFDSNKSAVKSHLDDIKNALVHQPSIQSDLSTSFDFNEAISDGLLDVSPQDDKMKQEYSVKSEENDNKSEVDTIESVSEKPDSLDLVSTVPKSEVDMTEPISEKRDSLDLVSTEPKSEEQNFQFAEKSLIDKIKDREQLVHQPSIQSDLSTSFEDKSDYMLSSGLMSPDNNQTNSTSNLNIDTPENSREIDTPENPREIASPVDLNLEDDEMSKSGVYFPESGVKFLQPESDSSISNDSSSTFSDEPSSQRNENIDNNTPGADLAEPDNNNQDENLLENELLKTSSALVETAFKEALNIEAAYREDGALIEALPSESNSSPLNEDSQNVSNTNTDTSADQQMSEELLSEAAIKEVAFSYANELIKEALDNYDEIMDALPPRMPEPDIQVPIEYKHSPVKLNKSNNSLSLETDYLPGMDPFRGNLDMYPGSEHTGTISTDAEKEVAEGASFRKISSEESPSQQKEFLEKLREEAELNKHVEATPEELQEATSDMNTFDNNFDLKSDKNSDVEDIESPDVNERGITEEIPKSESVYDNLADTPSSEVFEPFLEPVLNSEILTAVNTHEQLSSIPSSGTDSLKEIQGSIEFVEKEVHTDSIDVSNILTDDLEINTGMSNPLNESSTDDLEEGMDHSLEYKDTASAQVLDNTLSSQNTDHTESHTNLENNQKVEVEETMVKSSHLNQESSVSIKVDDVVEKKEIDPESETGKYSLLTEKQRKEVYMTSAGRMSIAAEGFESLSSMEEVDRSPTTDPRLVEEHRQPELGTTLDKFEESKVVSDITYKDEWQDDELPSVLESGDKIPVVDSSIDGISTGPFNSLARTPDTPTKRKILPDIDLFNDDVSEDDIIDELDDDEDAESNDLEWENDTPVRSTSTSEPIAEYTAAEELEDSKRWKVVNVGDKEYRIDLIVIEPYKKVISHGGYYGDGLNAIIVFSGCYLPDKRRKDYQYVMEHLFVYVVHSLEELVAEDYMIVYFHGATPKKQSPSFSWLKKCYQMIDRRLKKNLKSLFLVHPTLWLRTVVLMTKPFISSKFSSKLKFVKTLQDLGLIIPMENLNVPDAVKVYDEKIYQSLSTPSTTPSTPS